MKVKLSEKIKTLYQDIISGAETKYLLSMTKQVKNCKEKQGVSICFNCPDRKFCHIKKYEGKM